MHRVVIVEDEALVALEISQTLEEFGGYEIVGSYRSAEAALERIETDPPDIVLMDIRLAGEMDGIEAAERIAHLPLSVIFLSAFTDVEHIGRAATVRPVTYLAKPIDTADLRAALLLAVSAPAGEPETFRLPHGIRYDRRGRRIQKEGKWVTLTELEWRLLELLIERKGGVLGFYEMETALWPDRFPGESTRRALVKRLRDKLGSETVETLPRQGYRLTR